MVGITGQANGVSSEDNRVRALVRAAERRKRAGQFVLVSQIVVFIALLVAMISAVLGGVVTALSDTDQSKGLFDFGSGLLVFLFTALAIASYVALLFVPFLFVLPVTLALAVLWAQPRRFLVLRPFNREGSVRALRAVIRESIGHFGHTYTLSDKRIRVHWYVRIPLLLGQIAMFSFRPRTISTPRRLARLVAATRRRVLRNLNWCMTRSKIFAVRCTDAYWKQAVTELARQSDLVLIDISERRSTIAWEVEHCMEIGVIEKVVFLAEAGAAAEARAWIDANVGSGAPPLVRYTGAKLVDAALFQSLVVQHNLRTEVAPDRRARRRAVGIVVTGYSVMMTGLLILAWFLTPAIAPDWTMRHAPFPAMVERAYFGSCSSVYDTAPAAVLAEAPGRTRAAVYAAAQQRLASSTDRECALRALDALAPETTYPQVIAEMDRDDGSRWLALELLDARGRNLAALLEDRIAHPRYPGQASWAIDALGERPSPAATRVLAGTLTTSDEHLRRTAVHALSKHKALDALNDALASGIADAAFGLEPLVVPDNLDAFRSALASPHAAVRGFAAHAVLQLDDKPSFRRALTMMVDGDADASGSDIEHIVALATRDDVALLSRAAAREASGVRRAGIQALQRLGGPGAITAVAAGLKHDGWYRHPARDALAALVSADATPELVELLASDDPDARGFAFDALGEHGDERAVEQLLRKLGARGFLRGDPAFGTLARLHERGQVPLARLIASLDSRREIERDAGADLLRARPSPQVMRALIRALRSSGPRGRRLAADLLADYDDREARAALAGGAQHPAPVER